MAKKIVIAMSGGVDSSVSAALLKRAGFDVVGIFMKFWASDSNNRSNRCCTLDSERKAREVAKKINIPFYVLNVKKEFKKKVVDYFISESKKGRTPNPCVVCNKEIKFGLLLEKALKIKADFISTGHYALVEQSRLFKGKDQKKDQSYFLWQLSKKQLSHILFPLGKYKKEEVEKIAKKLKLNYKGIGESQEICFVEKNVGDFLKKYIKIQPGEIKTDKGEIIGEHSGLFYYTIGQRKGIGKGGGPYYVLEKKQKENILIVTKNEKKLFKKEAILEKVNLLSDFSGELKAKVRYNQKEQSAFLVKKNKTYFLKFKNPQRAITPGQSAVFFKNKEVIGGGIIRGTGN